MQNKVCKNILHSFPFFIHLNIQTLSSLLFHQPVRPINKIQKKTYKYFLIFSSSFHYPMKRLKRKKNLIHDFIATLVLPFISTLQPYAFFIKQNTLKNSESEMEYEKIHKNSCHIRFSRSLMRIVYNMYLLFVLWFFCSIVQPGNALKNITLRTQNVIFFYFYSMTRLLDIHLYVYLFV